MHRRFLPRRDASAPPDRTRRRLNLALTASAAMPLFAAELAHADAMPPLPRYTQPVAADAPLVGRVLRAGGQPLSPAQLCDACAAATLCLLGEQHDHPDHHAVQAWIVTALAAQGRLAAVALEMADAGKRFDGPRDASAAAVRAALDWNDAGWPWRLYAAPVMAAVRAGVPVVGVNLPQGQMSAVMQQARWDDSVPGAVRERIIREVIDSHCGLLPAAQAPAMARIQLARDDSMAAHSLALAQPGKTVALLTGSFHADRNVGIAQHIAAQSAQIPPDVARPPVLFSLLLLGLSGEDTPVAVPAGYDAVWFTPGTPPRDHCAELRAQLQRR